MDIGHVLAGIFWLIFAYLIFTHWQGANALLGTSVNGGGAVISDLQGNTAAPIKTS